MHVIQIPAEALREGVHASGAQGLVQAFVGDLVIGDQTSLMVECDKAQVVNSFNEKANRRRRLPHLA